VALIPLFSSVIGPALATAQIAATEIEITASDGAANERFGESVAIDGHTAVVGAQYAAVDGNGAQGAVYVYSFDPTLGWIEVDRLTASDGASNDHFGTDVALSGDWLLVSAPNADRGPLQTGRVYVFERTGGSTWQEVDTLVPSNTVGQSYTAVAFPGNRVKPMIALAGDVAVVGVERNGLTNTAHVFRRDPMDGWGEETVVQRPLDETASRFPSSVATDGTTVALGSFGSSTGASNAGSVLVLRYDDGTESWSPPTQLFASNPTGGAHLGTAVGVDGDDLWAGAPRAPVDGAPANTGLAYWFRWTGSGWTEEAILAPPASLDVDEFAASLAVRDGLVVFGSGLTSPSHLDAAHVFARSAGSWQPVEVLHASAQLDGTKFGRALSISDSRVLIGAYRSVVESQLRGAAYAYDASAGATPVPSTSGIATTLLSLVLVASFVAHVRRSRANA
jgi:hypothetical protein